MSKQFQALVKRNPNMMLVISFFVVFIVNMIVVGLANSFFPQNYVLGTHSLTYLWALMLFSGELALITTLIIPFVTEWEHMRKKIMSPVEWTILYFFVNFIAVWGLTRFSEVFGFGTSSWMLVLVLAVVLDLAQGMAMMMIEKIKTGK